jgi:hypothetical protein
MHETCHYYHLNIGFQCHDCFLTLEFLWSPCVIDKILIIVTLNIGLILNYLILLWIISHSKWNFNKGVGGVGGEMLVVIVELSYIIHPLQLQVLLDVSTLGVQNRHFLKIHNIILGRFFFVSSSVLKNT